MVDTPLTYVTYAGDGATTQFTFPFPYLDQAHIVATVDAVEVAVAWVNPNTVEILPAPANGTIVELRRSTPRDEPMVDFTDGSVLTERDLDLANTQVLYIVQEAIDISGQGMLIDATGAYDASTRRITNLGAPINAADAVTKAYVDSELPPLVALAESWANAAAASAAAAAQSALDAALFDPSSYYTKAQQDATDAAQDASISANAAAIAANTSALAAKAPLASPTFTGVPTVPTAAPGTNTGQAASTAFVAAALAAGGGGEWTFVSTIYDFSVGGATFTVETPTFVDGYEYMIDCENLSHDSGTNRSLFISFYGETAGAYGSPRTWLSAVANTIQKDASIHLPWVRSPMPKQRAIIFDASLEMVVEPYTATPQKVTKIKFDWEVAGYSGFDSGVMKLYRRAL